MVETERLISPGGRLALMDEQGYFRMAEDVVVDKANGQGASEAATAARAVCGEHGNRPDLLLEIMHGVQERLGCIPGQAIAAIATAVNLSRAEVHGVFTFYHDFREVPAGRHVIKLCRAEACQAVGCEALAAEAETALETSFGHTSADGRVTLEAVYCLGNCALGPSGLVDGKLYGRMNINKLNNIMKNLD